MIFPFFHTYKLNFHIQSYFPTNLPIVTLFLKICRHTFLEFCYFLIKALQLFARMYELHSFFRFQFMRFDF